MNFFFRKGEKGGGKGEGYFLAYFNNKGKVKDKKNGVLV